jgi:hypothetical protein
MLGDRLHLAHHFADLTLTRRAAAAPNAAVERAGVVSLPVARDGGPGKIGRNGDGSQKQPDEE